MTDETSKMLIFEQALNKILWPLLMLIGGLMDNSILFGSGMEATLREIWVPIRNIVNIFFVLALVGLAIYNVLGIAEDNTALKTLLPKIIIGLIAVNFSFLGIKVFLDAINVLTTSIFALPLTLNVTQRVDINDTEIQKKICAAVNGLSYSEVGTKSEADVKSMIEVKMAAILGKELGGDASGLTVAAIEATVPDAKKPEFKTKLDNLKKNNMCEGLKIRDDKKALWQSFDGNNAALALAVNTGSILNFSDISIKDIEGDPEKLFISVIFSMLMFLLYAISFVALFAVLLGRLAVMWVSIALSPVLIIIMFIPSIKDNLKALGEINDKFMTNAVAPIPIALSLTIGWIMLNAIKGTSGFSSASGYGAMDTGMGIPVVGLSTLQDLIASAGTLAVVWLGVFGAAEGTIAGGFTGALKGAAEGFGKFIGTAPFRFLPLVPISLKPGETAERFTPSAVLELFKDTTRKAGMGDQTLVNRINGVNPSVAIQKATTKEDLAKGLKDQEIIRKLESGQGAGDLASFRGNTHYSELKGGTVFKGLVDQAIAEEKKTPGSSAATQGKIAKMLRNKTEISELDNLALQDSRATQPPTLGGEPKPDAKKTAGKETKKPETPPAGTPPIAPVAGNPGQPAQPVQPQVGSQVKVEPPKPKPKDSIQVGGSTYKLAGTSGDVAYYAREGKVYTATSLAGVAAGQALTPETRVPSDIQSTADSQKASDAIIKERAEKARKEAAAKAPKLTLNNVQPPADEASGKKFPPDGGGGQQMAA